MWTFISKNYFPLETDKEGWKSEVKIKHFQINAFFSKQISFNLKAQKGVLKYVQRIEDKNIFWAKCISVCLARTMVKLLLQKLNKKKLSLFFKRSFFWWKCFHGNLLSALSLTKLWRRKKVVKVNDQVKSTGNKVVKPVFFGFKV